jgi:hypothetical protein
VICRGLSIPLFRFSSAVVNEKGLVPISLMDAENPLAEPKFQNWGGLEIDPRIALS